MLRSRSYLKNLNLKNILLLETKCHLNRKNVVLRSYVNQQLQVKDQHQNDIRFNEIGIQMISEKWRSILFGKKRQNNEEFVNKIKKNLENFGLNTNSSNNFQQIPEGLQIPKLFGANLDEHFKIIASQQSDKYVRIISNLIASEIPTMPKNWSFKQGWTRYDSNNPDGIQVEYPYDESLVFDVEVLVSQGNLPTMAVAVSDMCWYSWCSNTLIHDVFHHSSIFDELIPLEKTDKYGNRLIDTERIIICHNAGFDRSFVKEQYLPNRSKINFLDTMCLHIACSGLTSEQRALKNSQKSNEESEVKISLEKENNKYNNFKNFNFNSQPNFAWLDYGSANNLRDVHEFYCPYSERIEKEARNVFVTGTMNDVRQDFQKLMLYCANDVRATLEVLKSVFPIYLNMFPNPVTLSGMFEMGNMYLPVNENWLQYIQNCESANEDMEHISTNSLIKAANESCFYYHNEKYKNNIWLSDLDWSVRDYGLKKAASKANKKLENDNKIEQKDENIFEKILKQHQKSIGNDEEIELSDVTKEIMAKGNQLPKNIPYLCGYPKWYVDISEKPSEIKSNDFRASLISTKLRLTPKLLRLTWLGYPLHYIGDQIIETEKDNKTKSNGYGWGYLVPKNIENIEQIGQDLPFLNSFKEEFEMNDKERREKLAQMDNEISNIEEKLENLEKEIQKGIENIGRQTKLFRIKKSLIEKQKKQKELKAEFEKNSSKCLHHKGLGPIEINDEQFKDYFFFKIPHKDGAELRVGNPLSKDFKKQFKDGILNSYQNNYANLLMNYEISMSYWVNNEKRIKSQFVVWLPTIKMPNSNKRLFGAILPRTIVAGTITRRAVEPTWLTASNYKKDRIGSELKAMINAPDGYHFVGADVDSQELWIASLIGDSHFNGIHGATPIGWMNLQGKKSDGTDMHSRTAQIIGISRDHAKVINYGRIYGAGIKYAEQLLLQFNPTLKPEEAKEKAKIMYETTKGKKTKLLGENSKEIKKSKYTPNQKWIGGTESEMFNELEAIAYSRSPKTPVLKSSITRCLEPDLVSDAFMTSRINWVVQSSAVDYLHLILVSMKWLMNEFKIQGRFSISIHDEVRYLIKTEDRYKAALALQITNLLVRSLFSYQLGFDDLPLSIAFFSEVDVDKCLRKSVNLEFETPSNPLGLTKGYGIPQGESMDIYALLDKLKNENTEICK